MGSAGSATDTPFTFDSPTMKPAGPPIRIGLRDVARHLGVSHATISMALRDSPRVSAATRERVRKAAAELGYRPDPMLSALAVYRNLKANTAIHSAAAWINAWTDPEELRGYKEFDLYWKGASDCAARLGYRLEEFRVGDDLPPGRLHEILRARNIRGILLPPHGRMQPDWRDFPWEDYAVVRFGRSMRCPRAHLVTADQFANCRLALEKMRERGYRRIGLLAFESDLNPLGSRFVAGFLNVREFLGCQESFPVFRIGEPAPPDLAGRFHRWMEERKPDALLTTVEHKILLRDAGCRVPEDIPVAATSILDSGLDSGIDQNAEEIGRVGFQLLGSLIKHGERGIPPICRQILVEGKWVDGTNLPDRRER